MSRCASRRGCHQRTAGFEKTSRGWGREDSQLVGVRIPAPAARGAVGRRGLARQGANPLPNAHQVDQQDPGKGRSLHVRKMCISYCFSASQGSPGGQGFCDRGRPARPTHQQCCAGPRAAWAGLVFSIIISFLFSSRFQHLGTHDDLLTFFTTLNEPQKIDPIDY